MFGRARKRILIDWANLIPGRAVILTLDYILVQSEIAFSPDMDLVNIDIDPWSIKGSGVNGKDLE